jgi:hypothetical protein
MTTLVTHFSYDRIPLVLIDMPKERPLLTIENYTKWYHIYKVDVRGIVTRVDVNPEEVLKERLRPGETLNTSWSDHIPTLEYCVKLAEYLGLDWDENSLDMIAGRYLRQKTLEKDY